MKINIGNIDIFKSSKNLKVRRCAKSGLIIFVIATGLFANTAMLTGCTPTSNYEIVDQHKETLKISVAQINDLNVIINNSNCSESFIYEIEDELKKDGFNFTFTNKEKNINVNDAVVITLDQHYISGPGMTVLAPYENNRNGNSDALALAMQAGFYEKGFFVDEIQCGKMGYQQLEDGTIIEQIPSETESAIVPSNYTSFVTLCFGTNNNNPTLVADAIKLSLARYTNYINNEYTGTDLIYRSEISDTIEEVLEKTDGDISIIAPDGVLLNNTTVINGSVKTLDSFDRLSPVNIEGKEASVWHHK